MLKILNMELNARVKVRSKGNFGRFCMMKPRAGKFGSFCLKLSQSNLKGLVKILCEQKCHTKHGSVSRSGHERSRKVTKIKKIGHATHDIYYIVTFHVEFENRSHFAI